MNWEEELAICPVSIAVFSQCVSRFSSRNLYCLKSFQFELHVTAFFVVAHVCDDVTPQYKGIMVTDRQQTVMIRALLLVTRLERHSYTVASWSWLLAEQIETYGRIEG